MNPSTSLVLDGKIRFWSRGIWISALLIFLPPMLGLAAALIGMKQALADMGNSGIGDPPALSGHISMVLLTTLGSLVVSIAGIILCVVSTVRFLKFRAELRAPGAQPG